MPAIEHKKRTQPSSGDERRHSGRGFSLVELLIVVAIILVIAAIAVPNLLRARQSANESSAINSIRTLTNAEIAYAASYPEVGYTCTLTNLGPSAGLPSSDAAGFIDEVLASGQKSWYVFTPSNCTGDPKVTFFMSATPLNGGGTRKFCSDQTGILRYDPGDGDCTAASMPLQ